MPLGPAATAGVCAAFILPIAFFLVGALLYRRWRARRAACSICPSLEADWGQVLTQKADHAALSAKDYPLVAISKRSTTSSRSGISSPIGTALQTNLPSRSNSNMSRSSSGSVSQAEWGAAGATVLPSAAPQAAAMAPERELTLPSAAPAASVFVHAPGAAAAAGAGASAVVGGGVPGAHQAQVQCCSSHNPRDAVPVHDQCGQQHPCRPEQQQPEKEHHVLVISDNAPCNDFNSSNSRAGGVLQ